MARPVIAWLTDFGTRDHYVAAMKGVVLGICPDVSLVDITHDIPPHDVLAGSVELAAASRYFAPGTIFVAVVDPGVGSARRAIAVQAGGCTYVAPDNGVLTSVLETRPPTRLVEVTEPRYALPTISRTFEGRDRFAPAAAWLATGVELSALGRPLEEWHCLRVPKPRVSDGRVAGEVLRVDRFGNLVTNIDRDLFDRTLGAGGIEVSAGGRTITALVATYAEAPADGLCALFGSTGYLEIAVNAGSAAERLALHRGTPVTVGRA